MLYDLKNYFVIKNNISGMFWNDDLKRWVNIHDKLDVLCLAFADDNDNADEIEKEYSSILCDMPNHERHYSFLFKIQIETKIVF